MIEFILPINIPSSVMVDSVPPSVLLDHFIEAIGKDAPGCVMIVTIFYVGYKVFEKIWAYYIHKKDGVITLPSDIPPEMMKGINEAFQGYNMQIAHVEERLEHIEKAIDDGPKHPCDKHGTVENCMFNIKESTGYIEDIANALLNVLTMLIKGEFFHKHSKDGNIINIPTGLEELLNVRRDNKKFRAYTDFTRKP